MKLKLSPELELPLEAVTSKFAILAKSGVGKTYTASVMVEEMLKARMQVVVIDPTGGWYGLRSAADGKGPGLPIIIAGGEHADVPLEESSAKTLAALVMDNKYSMVLDLSELRKAAQKRFVAAFLDELYHANRAPIHVVVDEADLYAPQMVRGGEDPHVLGTMEDIVRRGRIKGIGITLITQRPSVLNKDVLTQVDALILLRLVGPQDRKAVDDWVNVNADREQRDALMASLPSLPIGTAWFWAPAWGKFLQTKIRTRETLDSSSTPKLGQKRIEPTNMADVNLEKIRSALAETIEKREAEDPAVLRRRITELEGELRKRPTEKVVEYIEVLPEKIAERIRKAAQTITEDANDIMAALIVAAGEKPRAEAPPPPPVREAMRIEKRTPISPLTPDDFVPLGDKKLSKAARAILAVLAQFPNGRTKQQLSILSGYSIKSSSFSNALGELRSAGYASTGLPVVITAQGAVAVGDADPAPTGRALVEFWHGRLGKAERAVLKVLLDVHPKRLTNDEIAARSSYSRTSSSFSNALGKLRSLELIEGYEQDGGAKAADIFFEGAARK